MVTLAAAPSAQLLGERWQLWPFNASPGAANAARRSAVRWAV